MLKSIFGMDIDDFRIKEGDIKVDSEEMKNLLRVVQIYHGILGNLLGELSEEEQRELENGLKFTEYFQNKYIVLGELRREQKLQYDILQKLNDDKFISGQPVSEIESMRRDVWGWYLEAKGKRESLQAEIDKIKTKEGF